MNKTRLFLLLIFLMGSLNFIVAQNQKIELPTFHLEIPEGMRSLSSDTSVLAKLSLDRDLFISVDDNMDKMLGLSKKNPNGVSKEIFKFAFDTKFSSIKDQYGGYNVSKKRTGKLKNLNYTAQNFICKASKNEEAYFEYRVIKIGGRYYEFIITGKKNLATAHQPVIKAFWNGVKEN